MWKVRGTSVVWEGDRKSADRPHVLTLLVGLLSPVLGIAALFISLQSLSTSERGIRVAETNMKVGQRGYVRLTGGTVRVSRPLELLLPLSRLNPPGQPGTPASARPPSKREESIGYWFTATLENLGNTPVRFTNLQVAAKAGGGIHLKEHAIDRGLPPELGQKVRYEWSWGLQALGDPKPIREQWGFFLGATQLRSRRISGRVTFGAPDFTFTLTYEDVFKEAHVVQWCWTPTMDAATGVIYGEDCRD